MKIIWNDEPTAPEAPFSAAPEKEEPVKVDDEEKGEAEKPKGFSREKTDKP